MDFFCRCTHYFFIINYRYQKNDCRKNAIIADVWQMYNKYFLCTDIYTAILVQ